MHDMICNLVRCKQKIVIVSPHPVSMKPSDSLQGTQMCLFSIATIKGDVTGPIALDHGARRLEGATEFAGAVRVRQARAD